MERNEQYKGIALMLVSAALASTGQLLWKLSAYNGNLNIACKVAEMDEAVKPEYNVNN